MSCRLYKNQPCNMTGKKSIKCTSLPKIDHYVINKCMSVDDYVYCKKNEFDFGFLYL